MVSFIWRHWLELKDNAKGLGQAEFQRLLEKIAQHMDPPRRQKFIADTNTIIGELERKKATLKPFQFPRWKDFLGPQGRRPANADFLKMAHSYVKEYCAFIVGNWNSPINAKGFAPTPKLDHYLRVFRERGIRHYVIDEFRTSKVK